MIKEINELETLKKYTYIMRMQMLIWGRNSDSDQCWNNGKCRCECKKRHVFEKDYVWNSATFDCKNGKYLASIMDDSAIICGETIEETVPTNLNDSKL